MDVGLLVLHLTVGLFFLGHGAQKIFGLFGGYGLEGTGGYMEIARPAARKAPRRRRRVR